MNTLLSKTEKQILEMRISGSSRKEIASNLFRSELTVKTHFQNIQKKTKSKDEIDMVLWYLKTEKGIVIAVLTIALILVLKVDLVKLAETITTSFFKP